MFLRLGGKKIHLQCRRPGFDPWVGKIPWRRAQKPTSVSLPGEFQGQRSLGSCKLWDHKELYMTERVNDKKHLSVFILQKGTEV